MKTKTPEPISFTTHSFQECVRLDGGLAGLRAEYARKSAKTRRCTAEWEYDSSLSVSMFGNALAAGGRDPLPFGEPCWPDGVLSLAIDPRYAPALLTVGSLEYQVGRKAEAMQLFLALTELSAKEPDLPIIIDKAGDFLLDQKDVRRAHDLYAAAEQAFPDVAMYPAGLGYCLGKQGKPEEAVAKARRASELEPASAWHLNDLGWSLFQAGQPEEAIRILDRAVALAPEHYDLPRENLRYVKAKLAKPTPPKKKSDRAKPPR